MPVPESNKATGTSHATAASSQPVHAVDFRKPRRHAATTSVQAARPAKQTIQVPHGAFVASASRAIRVASYSMPAADGATQCAPTRSSQHRFPRCGTLREWPRRPARPAARAPRRRWTGSSQNGAVASSSCRAALRVPDFHRVRSILRRPLANRIDCPRSAPALRVPTGRAPAVVGDACHRVAQRMEARTAPASTAARRPLSNGEWSPRDWRHRGTRCRTAAVYRATSGSCTSKAHASRARHRRSSTALPSSASPSPG